MNLFGHRLSDYLRLLAPLFGLIAAVWALRLVLDAAGASPHVVRLASVTLTGAVSILLAVLLIRARRLGGYANVVIAVVLLVLWEQMLIASAIAFSALSHTENVYSAPEFTPGHMSQAAHILGHLTFGVGFGVLFGSAVGCLFLLLLRKLLPAPPR
ncbi:MAG TPA: hypothetical protein VJV74_10420 [Terriglobia bacterium]|nr:hypothetical protein [Terriglobia bacterium]